MQTRSTCRTRPYKQFLDARCYKYCSCCPNINTTSIVLLLLQLSIGRNLLLCRPSSRSPTTSSVLSCPLLLLLLLSSLVLLYYLVLIYIILKCRQFNLQHGSERQLKISGFLTSLWVHSQLMVDSSNVDLSFLLKLGWVPNKVWLYTSQDE
jgi:hypothetical protein